MHPSPPTGPLAIWVAYNEASNAGDHDAAGTLVDPALAVLVNGQPAIGSVEEDRAIQSELLRSYPDYTRDYLSGMVAGDHACIEWRMRGTAAADVELPALDLPGVSIVRCAEGRIVEARLYHPTGVLDQITEHALAGLSGRA